MDGFGWVLNSVMQVMEARGVKIDPKEFTDAVETAKILLPRIASDFAAMEMRNTALDMKLTRVEKKLDLILKEFSIDATRTEIDLKIIAAVESVKTTPRDLQRANGAVHSEVT